MYRYILFVRPKDDLTYTEFKVPINACNADDAIREAKRLKKCLNDNHVVEIIENVAYAKGYII